MRRCITECHRGIPHHPIVIPMGPPKSRRMPGEIPRLFELSHGIPYVPTLPVAGFLSTGHPTINTSGLLRSSTGVPMTSHNICRDPLRINHMVQGDAGSPREICKADARGRFGNICLRLGNRVKDLQPRPVFSRSVSYTHLTLPTIYSV